MKIVVLDGYTENPGDLSWKRLEQIGDLSVYDRTNDEKQAIERIGDAEIIYTNKTPITREIIKSCKNLAFIGVLATGYNIIDLEAVREAKIIVTNVPSYGTAAVAQYTMAMLLELCHHIGSHSEAVKLGEWSTGPDWCFWKTPLIELSGKTLGIIGLGKIGRATASLAESFGMKILAFDKTQDATWEQERRQYADIDTLLKESDVISLHCPLFPETEAIINKENIGKMKDGVLIINTSRGALVKEIDLAEALNTGKVAGAAVDVVSEEPIKSDNPLLTAKNIVITPHIAWASKESRQRLMDIAVDNLKSYLEGETKNRI